MIPQAAITAWAARAPWPTPSGIEQDLILSRLMIEIASDDLLGPELAMRGGTCLHKLHLPAPLRYSEDLDYVRRTRSGFGQYADRLRMIGVRAGLTFERTEQAGQMLHVPDRGRS